MTRIAVLTPDPADPSYSSQWPGVLERLQAALSLAGIEATPVPWTDHVEDASDLTGYPLVLPLIVWGYHRDHARWMQACRSWTEAGVRMLNPAEVIGWNSDKSYLGRLAEKGVAIAHTLWVDGVTQGDVDAAFDRFGADTIIVKPRVSGGAFKTLRLSRGDRLEGAPEGPAMIQPYLPTIETEGETSLLFFGGALSHVVNKRPVDGDFRIQVQFGGRYVALSEPPAGALTLAQQTLAAIDEDLLYARIDMAPDADGNWLLMEAELIEPDFYLASAPEGGARFAEAVRAKLSSADRSGHIIRVDGLPDQYPTHQHQAAFWEELGRTVGTFGFLEETLAKAIFALTATVEIPEDRLEDEFRLWGEKLRRAVSDPMGPLIDAYAKALREHTQARVEGKEQLIDDLRYAARIRNVLCHGSWGPPDEQGRSLPLFVDKKLQKFETAVDVEKLRRIREGAVGLTCSVINTVTHMGWQFPGTRGPGKRIWPSASEA